MAYALTVTNPFGPYGRGDAITDPKVVAAVLASEHRIDVVKVSKPDEPAPKGKPTAD